jgi:hypothetical protein
MSLILLIHILIPSVFPSIYPSDGGDIKNISRVMITIIYIIVGILLGLEYFISMLTKEGNWRVSLPKIAFMGIPSLYFCIIYCFSNYYNREKILFYPLYAFSRFNEFVISTFPLILGYSIITSFYKYNKKDVNIKSQLWSKYLNYSLVILIIQVCTGAFMRFIAGMKVQLFNFIMIILCGGLGFILGLEYLVNEAKKTGTWKINLPKIVLMGIPSLYFSIYTLILATTINSNIDIIAYPILILINKVSVFFTPIFKLMLGYFITTSFKKCTVEEK